MTPEERERLFAAFERGDDYIDALADELYLTKVRVYGDTLAELADDLGFESEDISIGDDIARDLSDEADMRAEQIAETYNTRLRTRIDSALADLPYDEAVQQLASWSNDYDENRSQLIAITESYTAHADATVAFFVANDLEVEFDFGGHAGDAPPACPICQSLEARNPHPAERVIAIGTPHPNCRQSWHPHFDPDLLPDEIVVGLGSSAGIVGQDSLITRTGSLGDALTFIEQQE